MTTQDVYDFYKNIDFTKATKQYKNIYYYNLDSCGIFVITENDNIVGSFIVYGDDIQIEILPKYRHKHYMSNFIKSGIWKPICKHLNSVTMDIYHIESIDDYNMKVYMFYKLLNLKIKNTKQAFDYVVYMYGTIQEQHLWENQFREIDFLTTRTETQQKQYDIVLNKLNNLHTYNDIINVLSI